MRREKQFERSASDKALRLYRVPNFKIVPWGGENGWPDRCYLIPGGRPLLIEYKWPDEPPAPKQEYIHEMLRNLGYDVIICDNEADALAAIKERCEAALQ